MKYNFCTIIDYKFISHFLIQYNSFKQIVKNRYVFWVLCVDYESYTFLQKCHLKNVQVLYWKDIADTKLHEQRIKHNDRIERFCWISKTYFLKYLLQNQHIEKVLYLDADMMLLSDPQRIFEKYLQKYNVCLTPHYFSRKYTQDDFAQKYGTYNAGFIGVNQYAMDFLNWWQKKCYARCGRFRDLKPEEGCIDDQGYLDSAKYLFPAIGDVGREYNVGPWNVHGVTRRNGKIVVGKKEVVFYHFHQLHIEHFVIRRRIKADLIYDIRCVEFLYTMYEKILKKVSQKITYGSLDSILALLQSENIFDVMNMYHAHCGNQRNNGVSSEAVLRVLYTLASKHKREGRNTKAKKYFSYIAETDMLISDVIRGGAYFHLGDIVLGEKQKKYAQKYFKECVLRIPDHQKAKKHLQN